MATSPVNLSNDAAAALAAAGRAKDAPPVAAPKNSLANQAVFLQLLVAQLKNQNPDNPADGTAFVTQLAQFVTLEQQTRATADLEAIRKLLEEAIPVTQALPQPDTQTASPAALASGAGQASGASTGSAPATNSTPAK